MARDPRNISLTPEQMIQRRLAEIEDARYPVTLKKAGGGAAGPEGPKGGEGTPAAMQYVFSSTITEADPTTGKFRLNNATLSAVTKIFISETNALGVNINAWLATLDDSTTTAHRGFIVFKEKGAPENVAIYDVTAALTDNGTWDTFTVTHIASGGSFSNNDNVMMEFYRTGDKGEAGTNGTNGTNGETGKEGPPGAATMADFKESVRCCTPGNVTIATALNVGDTVDGVVLAENDRVLVANQTTKKENGIYKAAASPARTTDADGAGELSGGSLVYVEEGTIYADRVMVITSNGAITIGTTEQTWAPVVPKNHGIVEALPTTSAVKGDRCSYKVAAGVYWDLIYTEEATYPWAKVGGPPLLETKAEGLVNSEVLQAGPSITVPLAMEARIRGGSNRGIPTAGAFARAAVIYNGVVQVDTFIGATTQGSLLGVVPPIKCEKSKTIHTDFARTGGAGEIQFVGLWIEVDPMRVG